MKRLHLLAAIALVPLSLALGQNLFTAMEVQAQNTQCSDRPFGDSTNACADTRFVQNAVTPISATVSQIQFNVSNAVFAPTQISLPSGKILIGTATNVANAQTMSGSCTITNAGVITCSGATLGLTPQVRVTLNTGTPVMKANFAAQTTVFVTPYVGGLIPIYDGTNMNPTQFAEVSQLTTDATKSPAAVAASSAYDIYCWIDTGVNRCTRGPAWTSLTARSAGTAQVRVQGILLNSVSITNGPAAQRGTYVGTIASNGTSTIDWIYGAVSSGCTAATFGVWNMYNRDDVKTFTGDTTASWTYNVANTTREIKGNTNCSISAVRGYDEDDVGAAYNGICLTGAATNQSNGVGLDSTTTFAGNPGYCASTAVAQMPRGEFSGAMGLGYHSFTMNERQDTTTTSTWFGLVAANLAQSGMHVSLRQ